MEKSPRTLAPWLVVVLNYRHGVHLPAYDHFPEVSLGPDELYLLLTLVRDGLDDRHEFCERVSCELAGCADSGLLREFLEQLDQRGLLIPAVQVRVSESGARNARPVLVPEEDRPWVARMPLVFRLVPDGFEMLDHDGNSRACLTPAELMALGEFREVCTRRQALENHRQTCGARALDEQDHMALLARLIADGLVRDAREAAAALSREARKQKMYERVRIRVREAIRESVRTPLMRHAMDAEHRVPVIPVSAHKTVPPLALGMIIGAAREFEGGRLQKIYDFVPDWQTTPQRLAKYARRDGIYLFSSYLWCHEGNLAFSAMLKERNPRCITVHGGPDVPKYPSDVEAYFNDHPHVDVIVHGEGEHTACELLAALDGCFSGTAMPDISALGHVAGLSFRHRGEVVRTVPRNQFEALDSIPSPYLNGLFDAYARVGLPSVIIETNRGCPYGCTFCDWGSATASKVRKFSLDRVFAELEWCARNQVQQVYLADANFGMLERDVEIARRVAELKRKFGYPQIFGTNYAKNKTRYLRPIISILSDAGVLAEGLLSLQTMDPQTLEVIDRANIKTSKYDELAREFHKAGLPMFVDLMLGLPGSTVDSFQEDLQQCVDREVTARIFQTELLVNSPMNAPAYRERHMLEVASPADGGLMAWNYTAEEKSLGRRLVVACTSFTRADYDRMLDMRRAFVMFENFGLLRLTARFVRQETGVRETDFYEAIRNNVRDNPVRWPNLALVLRVVPGVMAPPVSWRLYIAEVHEYLLEAAGLNDSSALQTILQVQHALLPAGDRHFPLTLSLRHDVGAWHAGMLALKNDEAGGRWHEHLARLEDYPPAQFEVSDPRGVCMTALGYNVEGDITGDWELVSPVSRPMPGHYRKYAELG